MVEFYEEPEHEPTIPSFLRKQQENGKIHEKDRLRKHLHTGLDQPPKPRVKVFPSGVTEGRVFVVTEVEVPAFLMAKEQANEECKHPFDEDTETNPSW